MESISTFLKDIKLEKSRPTEQPRQILVNQLCSELNITDKKLIRGIFFSGVPDNKLRECWQTARAWKVNPSALFYKLLKQAKYEQHTHNTPK